MLLSLRYCIIRLNNNTALWWSLSLAATAATIALLLRIVIPTNLSNSFNDVPLYIGLVVALSFLCFFILARIMKSLIITHYRRDRFRHPLRIGILDGSTGVGDLALPIDGDFPTPQQWLQAVGQVFHDNDVVCMISTTQIDNKYCMILNPFGEIYPEEDLSRRKSFFRIKAYIEHGGIFVNTSGLAFYYMFDTRTGQRFITGEPLEVRMENQPAVFRGFTNPIYSWLRENFQVRITVFPQPEPLEVYQLPEDRTIIGDLVNIGGTNEVNEWRASVYHPSLIPFLRSLKPRHNPNEECYPLAAIKHGIGYLLLTGFKPDTIGWRDKIGAAITNLSRTIMRAGTLDISLD